MATQLGSPGVAVDVINESFYNQATPGTVPIIFVATAQDKPNASKTGTALGTTAENAGKVWLTTGQRELSETFGTPLFYTDVGGNPIHAGELNEYGLQAGYSALGVVSRAYIVRADVDLAQLTGSSTPPVGDPAAGTYWVDTDASLWGVFEWLSTGNGKGSFVKKTPLVIDATNVATAATDLVPNDDFGKQGDYAMVVTSDNENTLWYKTTAASNAWVKVQQGFDGGKDLQISPHYTYPNFGASSTGSVWIKTTTPGSGANWSIKYYNGSTQTWNSLTAPIYSNTVQAIAKLDSAGGGENVPVGSVFIESNFNHGTGTNVTADFKVWRRTVSSVTPVMSAVSLATNTATSTIVIRESVVGSADWGPEVTINVQGSTTTSIIAKLAEAINSSALINVSATYNANTKKIIIKHDLGGDIAFIRGTASAGDTNVLDALGFVPYDVFTKTGTDNLYAAANPAVDGYDYLATGWKPLRYEAKATAPYTTPENGRLWYDVKLGEVDIMVNDGSAWRGYRDMYPDTNADGPIVAAMAPTEHTDGTPLVDKDIWISTASLERYGKDVYVYDIDNAKWVAQDVTDNNSPDGWIFANARWANTGTTLTASSIADLAVSNYVDPDAPDPTVYPAGIKLWNLRRSGYTVKKYMTNYINVDGTNDVYNNESMAGYAADRWVCVSPNNEDRSGSFGRHAQRGFVVAALASLIDTNTTIRDTDTLIFNLIACPGYPEVVQHLVNFNTDRGQTAFVVGDTPFRLEPTATALTDWGNNAASVTNTGDEGTNTYDEYMSMFYPSGLTKDNSGNSIVVPPSHMMLRTIIRSDAKSYQWFAPAGTQRGTVDNADSVGYVDAATGEYKVAVLSEPLRNAMAPIKINPIATLGAAGLVNMGQYTRAREASALDRINVARLVAYLRRQLSILAKPFLFEPNDEQTRREIKAAVESLCLELVGQRALYDFIVVCDKSNNTPARIDRSELYLDMAIEPVKAVEFIYIPLRIKNTGEIAAGL